MSRSNPINDVRRKINEIMKKTDEKIVVGWRPGIDKERKEGEVWKDREGREWTMKNGIKQTVSHLDSARIPLFCPHCERVMNHRFDTKFWNLRGKCYECVIKDETEMRRTGEWKEYEEKLVRANFRSALVDRIEELKELHRTIKKPEVLLADDVNILMKETWNVDMNKVKQDIQDDIDYYEEILRKFDNGEPLDEPTEVKE